MFGGGPPPFFKTIIMYKLIYLEGGEETTEYTGSYSGCSSRIPPEEAGFYRIKPNDDEPDTDDVEDYLSNQH